MRRFILLGAVATILGGCATMETPPGGARPALSADEGRALVRGLLPERLADRSGWATDIYAALATLDIEPTAENACAVIAVAEQESGLRVDPPVPGLSRIARAELDARRERAGIPKLVVDAALALTSSNGKTYGERLDAVTTEGQLSELYEDMIARVPFGPTLFADRNPIRTGGPMQVGVAFAEAQIEARPYPYPLASTVRREVFTRRGGLYFGIAHLLDYSAPYDSYRYRFADYNAGRYASRNAAFQAALTQVSGIPLVRDGDLLRYDGGKPTVEAGATERAARVVALRLGLTTADVRRDLEHGGREDFAETALYKRVFAQADALARGRAPRAIVPTIELSSPKITRKLTTAWFAGRVESRFHSCLGRSAHRAARVAS